MQKAFSLRKAFSDEIADVNPAEKETMRRLTGRIKRLDDYIESSLPEWGQVRNTYADAMTAEEFASWLPLNKNLSPNVLRSWAGLGMIAHGARNREILPILMAGGVSPRVWGGVIRAGATAPQAVRSVGVGGARLAGQYASGIMTDADRVEELRRKYMQRR